MANRTPPSEWGRLFNFAGGGLVHMELYELLETLMAGQTFLEWFAATLLLRGTHAARPAATDVPVGAEYYETDTANRFKAVAGAWVADGQSGSPGTLDGCLLYRSTAQTIPNATLTLVSYDTVVYDNGDMHNPAVNPERLTAQTAGIYLVTATAQFAANATGNRYLVITKNDTTDLARTGGCDSENVDQALSVTALINLAVGDFVNVSVTQTSGGNLNVQADAIEPCRFAAQLITA